MKENVLKKLFRNEVTWIIIITSLVWGAVQTVVLPIQSLQIQAAQTSKDIAEIKLGQSDIPQMKTDIQVLNTKLDTHLKMK